MSWRILLAIGNRLLQLHELESVHITDQFKFDTFASAPQHLHGLLVCVALDGSTIHFYDLIINCHLSRPKQALIR